MVSDVRYVTDDDGSVVEEIVSAPEEKYREADDRREVRHGKQFGVLQISDYDEHERRIVAYIELKDGRTVPLNIVYDPALVNDAVSTQVQQLQDDGETLAAATVFCEVVKSWGAVGTLKARMIDVDENDKVKRDERGNPLWVETILVGQGEPVPLDPSIVQYMRSDVINGCWAELYKDASGGKQRESRKKSRRH